jgi:hypothetical protein
MKTLAALVIACWAVALPANEHDPTEQEKQKCKELGDQIERITQALKKYKVENGGQLPTRLRDLIPKYLKSKEDLALRHLETSLPEEIDAYLVWINGGGIPHPDDPKTGMIAFTPSEVSGGGRYVIDSSLELWWMGEGAFQDWIFGHKFDEGNKSEEGILTPVDPDNTEQDGTHQPATRPDSEAE